MPPSGFSQEAINGLLIFVREIYQKSLDRYKDTNLKEKQFLEEDIMYLDKLVKESVPIALESVSEPAIRGLQQFVSVNYRDLFREIIGGKKQEGEALQGEIQNIEDYLRKFKL